MDAMRVLTDPAETGAVTLALPQDVQAEAWDWPEELFRHRVWHVPRPRADLAQPPDARRRRSEQPERPLIVAGGGVTYSQATEALRTFARATGIPVAETQAGRGAMPETDPLSLGAVGATGTEAANIIAAQADLVIGIGTRFSDFTTASHTAFADPDVRFVTVNIAAFDAAKHAGIAVVADARAALEELTGRRSTGCVPPELHTEPKSLTPARSGPRPSKPRTTSPTSRRPQGPIDADRGHRRRQRRRRPPATSSSAPPARCPATCTNSGAPAATRSRTTSSTATPAWATRSPAASA